MCLKLQVKLYVFHNFGVMINRTSCLIITSMGVSTQKLLIVKNIVRLTFKLSL